VPLNAALPRYFVVGQAVPPKERNDIGIKP
jgi:hypothetical protein